MEYAGKYLCWGPPGTGKTTRLSASVAKIIANHSQPGRVPAIVCSLTRAAAAEVVGRDTALPPGSIGTLHSHAYRAIGKPELATKNIKQWNEQHPEFAMSGATATVDDVVATDAPAATAGDKLLSQYDRHRAHMTDATNSSSKTLREFVECWEGWKQENGYVDFSDMISIALETTTSATGDPVVILVDEAQDMSALEFALLNRWAEQADALILFGDPYQSLYVWRGACPEVLMDHDATRQVLAQSYRVPRAVHERAMGWVKRLSTYEELDYKPREADGSVKRLKANFKWSLNMVNEIRDVVRETDQTVMVCAPAAYMLNDTIKLLRERFIPFANPWRRKQANWNPYEPGAGKGTSTLQRVLAFMAPAERATERDDDFAFGANVHPTRWTNRELGDWIELVNTRNVLSRGGKAIITHLADTRGGALVEDETLKLFADPTHITALAEGRETATDAISWLEDHLRGDKVKPSAFVREAAKGGGLDVFKVVPRVFVGTIHSFKGAEADVVYVIPDVSKAAYRQWIMGDRDGVVRMFYVAMTRAREELVILEQATKMAVWL